MVKVFYFLMHNPGLKTISYTLQIGRDAMSERLAIVTPSIAQLIEALKDFVQEQKQTYHWVYGRVEDQPKGKPSKDNGTDTVAALVGDGSIEKWGNKLATLWTQGLHIDWGLLWEKQTPCRIALPVYPFTRERYWINQKDITPVKRKAIALEHPLIDQEESGEQRRCFYKWLESDAFYLRDHKLGETSILPAVIFLEWAYTLGCLLCDNSSTVTLRNVSWQQSILLKKGMEDKKKIALYCEGKAIELCDVKEGRKKIFAQGEYVCQSSSDVKEIKLDLSEIEARCSYLKTKQQCYDLFLRSGLNYGKTFQTIRSLKHSEEEALGSIEMASEYVGDFSAYHLHPSLMDGVMQCVIGLIGSISSRTGRAFIPFALSYLEVFSIFTEGKCMAYVKMQKSLRKSMTEVKTFDIDVCDAQGIVLLRFKELIMKAVNAESSKAKLKDPQRVRPKLYYYEPIWKEAVWTF